MNKSTAFFCVKLNSTEKKIVAIVYYIECMTSLSLRVRSHGAVIVRFCSQEDTPIYLTDEFTKLMLTILAKDQCRRSATSNRNRSHPIKVPPPTIKIVML